MTSSPKKIIRGAAVQGVLFCTPTGADKEDPVARQESDNLKALEDFWYKKGFEEGQEKGFELGRADGEQEGHRRGLQEGEQRGREEGKQEGYESGLEEGEERVKAEFSDAIARATAAADAVKEYQESLFDEAKAEMVSFALAVCEQVLRTHLSDPDHFKQVVETVIHQAQPVIKDCPVEITFSRDDLARLQGSGLDEVLKKHVGDGPSAIRFIAEEGMRSGDCRLETSLGLVNFDIGRILDDLERKVLEVRPGDIPAEAPSSVVPPVSEEAVPDAVPVQGEGVADGDLPASQET